MSASNSESTPLFGFLRVTDLGGPGLIGGYLLLNLLGRPLEFHCTEPVKPNRAQQILYGDVLEAYLYGEQIAQTLVTHSRLQPSLILTDQPAVLSLRDRSELPVVLVAPAQTPERAPSSLSASTPITAAGCTVWISNQDAAREPAVRETLAQLSTGWNLMEPFRRIEDAVSELQKAA